MSSAECTAAPDRDLRRPPHHSQIAKIPDRNRSSSRSPARSSKREAQRELRHGVEQAFVQYENRLKADFEQTRSYLEAAREIVSAQTVERSFARRPGIAGAGTGADAETGNVHRDIRRTPSRPEREGTSLEPGARERLVSLRFPLAYRLPEPHAAREVAPVGRARALT